VPLGTAASWDKFQSDSRLPATFLRYFDQLTPENEMKWDSIHPQPLVYDFTVADQMVNWARGHGKRVRGHTLIWGSQNPLWINQGTWTRDTLLGVMQDHINTVVQHFRGRVREWDVVNEAIDINGRFKDNVWYRVIGPSYLDYAFRFARQADPSAQLYYNDWGLDLPYHPHTQGIYSVVRGLRSRGVPINGVGIQGHVGTGIKASGPQVAQTMRRFAALGLNVAITEMDVRTDRGGPPAQERQWQRAIYADYAQACRMEPRCTSFTTWGISDRYSWYAQDHPGWRPLMFDSNFSAKPALSAVRGWIKGR
jgi:endo-1,4-beta-xylanase